MLTRRAKAYSSFGSRKVNIHNQIFYLDRITIIAWRHLLNDIDLCRSPKSPKIHKTPDFGV